MEIWQVAAGDGDRDYADIFLDFGIVAAGPGDPGHFEQHRDSYSGIKEWKFLRAFHDDLAIDDLLVLKRPRGRQWEVLAVGKVTSAYDHRASLEDVEGWDLQHCREVDWRKLPKGQLVSGLTRGTLKRIHAREPREFAETWWKRLRNRDYEPAPLPPTQTELEDEELVALLIDKGLPTMTSERTVATIGRLRWLAHWYANRNMAIGEHEIRTFLVAPFLLALGWPEQRIRIEYQRADMALWDRPFSDDGASVTTIVETKRLYDSLGSSPVEQAAGYAHNHDSCTTIAITDGFRYKIFQRNSKSRRGEASWDEVAYANLLKLREKHPIRPEIGGAGELIVGLLP